MKAEKIKEKEMARDFEKQAKELVIKAKKGLSASMRRIYFERKAEEAKLERTASIDTTNSNKKNSSPRKEQAKSLEKRRKEMRKSIDSRIQVAMDLETARALGKLHKGG